MVANNKQSQKGAAIKFTGCYHMNDKCIVFSRKNLIGMLLKDTIINTL